jgi:hypothetical protein
MILHILYTSNNTGFFHAVKREFTKNTSESQQSRKSQAQESDSQQEGITHFNHLTSRVDPGGQIGSKSTGASLRLLYDQGLESFQEA